MVIFNKIIGVKVVLGVRVSCGGGANAPGSLETGSEEGGLKFAFIRFVPSSCSLPQLFSIALSIPIILTKCAL